MKLPDTSDTIVAQATPPGAGALAVIRISGPAAFSAASSFIFPAPREPRHALASLLHIKNGGALVDRAVVIFYRGPASYTGDDTVEISCHGSPYIIRTILNLAIRSGARPAEAGEFTLRAFLNGKLDLTQAEAVAETIAAPTRAALHLAQLKLSGALSRRISDLRTALESLRAQLCLAVDFPDEDMECLPLPQLRQEALQAAEGVERLLAGRVNAGKSSLLNALVGRRRAIVSATPGTTRDYLEEQLDLSGLLVRLVDTAGLRGPVGGPVGGIGEEALGGTDRGDMGDAVDPVEAQGQDLSREFMGRAEAVLYVLDAAAPLHLVDRTALEGLAPGRTLVVLNKSDLRASQDFCDEALDAARALGLSCVRVSAKTGEGLEELCARLRERLTDGRTGGRADDRADDRADGRAGGCVEPDPDEVAPNARQAAVLRLARTELMALADDAGAGLPYDILGVRLEAACRLLSELTGEIAPEAVLQDIFSRFCLGK